jgi:hypothetical protein
VLSKAFNRWVNRCEAIRNEFVLFIENALVAGVDHFQTLESGTYFPVAAQPGSAGKLLFLCSPEMEESQSDATGAVGYHRNQHGPARPDNGCVFYLPFYLYLGAGIQTADWVNACSVFVAQRQVKQKVLNGVYVQLR